MGNTPVLKITPAGPVRPTFPDCLGYEQASTRSIYGQDLYLGNDCQDGQLTAFRAEAYHDVNGEVLSAYASFSPGSARGAALDRIVKINGLRRKSPTYSTVPVTVEGVAGTTQNNIVVVDPAGVRWNLPSVLTIPFSGQITVNATCATIGAIRLASGALDTSAGNGSIFTPQYGLQRVYNTADAAVGAPVELDSALRIRQAVSTALPSVSIADGLAGALFAIANVNRLKVYENDTSLRDSNGIPAHAVSCVLDGGDPNQIASIIRLKKGPGVPTYGSTIVPIVSTSGVSKKIAFFYLTNPIISYALTVTNRGGFTTAIAQAIAASLVGFTTGLDIGESVERDQAFAAAKLYDGDGSKTFKINSFALARDNFTPGPADVPILFNEAATAAATNVSITVLPSS